MQETLPNEQPEYKLGMTDEERTTFVGPDPTDMTFDAFAAEYETVMNNVAAAEKHGNLDPYAEYQPMTEDDWRLMAEDWKAFSRSRGYTEEEIAEYERWLELSGQKQQIPYAINDPWRRSEQNPTTQAARTYLKLLQQRIEQGERPLSPEVMDSKVKAEKAMEESQMPYGSNKASKPLPMPVLPNDDDDLDVW